MALFFITGNKNKFEQIKSVIPNVEQLDIDLSEIQDIDPHVVIANKLLEASKKHSGEFIVEDTSLTILGMNGLPGTFIKWFLKTIGNEGIFKLTELFGALAQAKVLIGYTKDGTNVEYFEGTVEGTIVEPKGDMGFGWDPIFKPTGSDKTFAEFDSFQMEKFNMRKVAALKLKEFLE